MIWKISHPGQIRNLLANYESHVEGSSIEKGKLYSNFPFPQFENIPFYRDNTNRVEFVNENLKNKHYNLLIDLGCNMGQMIFWLYEEGKKYYGLDYDTEAIMIAEQLKKVFLSKGEIEFVPGDIRRTLFKGFENTCFLLLSTFQWIVKKHGLEMAKKTLIEINGKGNILFFETSGSDSMAPLSEADSKEWIINLLNDCGWKIEKEELLKADTGGDRWIFCCVNKNE